MIVWFLRTSRALWVLLLSWSSQLYFLEQPRMLLEFVLLPQCQALEIGHRHPEHLVELLRGQVSLGGHVETDHTSTYYGYVVLRQLKNK